MREEKKKKKKIKGLEKKRSACAMEVWDAEHKVASKREKRSIGTKGYDQIM